MHNFTIDLITIFPGIILETHSLQNRQTMPDPNLSDDFSFCGSRIVSYKKLISSPGVVISRQMEKIKKVSERIIDSSGMHLDDFLVIIDSDIEYKYSEIPSPASQQIVSYFSYLQQLDHFGNLDFAKLLFFKPRGYQEYINNKHIFYHDSKAMLLTPGQNELWIHKNEKILLDLFSKLQKDMKEQFNRIINSISLFNESRRAYSLNQNAGIVLIVSAFESLLNLPRYSKKENFAHSLKMLWNFEPTIENWARQLYELRSTIVHGDKPGEEELSVSPDRHYPHYEIASMMFHHCLLFILEGYGFVRTETVYKKEKVEMIKNLIKSNKKKVSEILAKKKSFNYKAFSNNKNLYKEFIQKLENLTLTDYSAKNSAKELLGLILEIGKDWIEAERNILSKGKWPKDIVDYRIGKFDEIVAVFEKIKKINWKSERQRELDLRGYLDDLKKIVRTLVRIFYDRDDFHFSLAEFLKRSLDAISHY